MPARVASERRVFFSSRRRHTRFDCDWSSDVCSSDLWAKSEHGPVSAPDFRDWHDQSTAFEAIAYYQGRDTAVMAGPVDRKSTRLNSSHSQISYAVFCLKKKKNKIQHATLAPKQQTPR